MPKVSKKPNWSTAHQGESQRQIKMLNAWTCEVSYEETNRILDIIKEKPVNQWRFQIPIFRRCSRLSNEFLEQHVENLQIVRRGINLMAGYLDDVSKDAAQKRAKIGLRENPYRQRRKETTRHQELDLEELDFFTKELKDVRRDHREMVVHTERLFKTSAEQKVKISCQETQIKQLFKTNAEHKLKISSQDIQIKRLKEELLKQSRQIEQMNHDNAFMADMLRIKNQEVCDIKQAAEMDKQKLRVIKNML